MREKAGDEVAEPKSDPDYSLALEEARRTFQGVADELPALRTRTTQILSISGLTASFLGGVVIVAGKPIGFVGAVAILAFIATVVLGLLILLPKKLIVSVKAEEMIQWAEAPGATLGKMQKALALALDEKRVENRANIDRWSKLYVAAIIALLFQVIAFVINVWSI